MTSCPIVFVRKIDPDPFDKGILVFDEQHN
jgi:hypothetical protein